jgi:lipid-binding SYLF domain-containing protein
MNIKIKLNTVYRLCAAVVLWLCVLPTVLAEEDRPGLDADVHATINLLKETNPVAKALGPNGRGALVFPKVTKAGFVIGGLYGTGALVKAKQGGGYYIDGYFNIAAASYGFQAGAQSFGYVLLLMNDAAVEHVESSSNWDLGLGPSIVVVDKGMAKTLTVATADADVYSFTFGQKGLMAGLGLQGSKITKLD